MGAVSPIWAANTAFSTNEEERSAKSKTAGVGKRGENAKNVKVNCRLCKTFHDSTTAAQEHIRQHPGAVTLTLNGSVLESYVSALR